MGDATTADVIVIGLGAMGSATCLRLAQRGADVIGLDRFAPPHPFGSTHGDTRITRLAIAEGPEYVPLVRRSHELWRELEAQSGERLLVQCGALILGHETSPFLSGSRESAREHGIVHESLTADELAGRFPMFAVDPQTEGYFEPSAGYVRPERAVAVQLEQAARLGVRLLRDVRAARWHCAASGRGVTVRTDSGEFTAAQLVLCAGAWIGELFASPAFSIYRQQLYWFPIRRGYEQLRQMPVFGWELARGDEAPTHLGGFYGFPAIDGPDGGIKVATERYEATVVPDGGQHPPTPGELEEMVARYLRPCLPWVGHEPLRTASCLYTCTPGNRFVIDRHPEHEQVLIVSPCSGHGFKHSAAIGEAVAQVLTDGHSALDLSAFSLSRVERR